MTCFAGPPSLSGSLSLQSKTFLSHINKHAELNDVLPLLSIRLCVLCGLWESGVVRRPAPFPGQMSYEVTKPGSVYFCLSIVFHCVVLLIMATFCIVSLSWYVFCLLVVWLSCQYLPSNWLERLSEED